MWCARDCVAVGRQHRSAVLRHRVHAVQGVIGIVHIIAVGSGDAGVVARRVISMRGHRHAGMAVPGQAAERVIDEPFGEPVMHRLDFAARQIIGEAEGAVVPPSNPSSAI